MFLRAVGALLLVALAVLSPFAETAFAEGPRGSGSVVITSSPPGAVVELRGEHAYSGVTPWRLDRGLSGVYEILATKTGYADWTGSTSVSAGRTDSLFIRMTRKSQMATGLRSAILPGWGQFYAGQTLKGTVFLLAEAGAVTGALIADSKREDAMRIHERAIRAYNSADQVDEIEAAYDEMLNAFDDVERWHENRKRWIYAAGAVWIANVLDATLLVPSDGGGLFAGLPDPNESSLFASVDADRTVLGFSVSF
ncbi:MAG: DUF5683 domain-containing protein [Candidatus Eisenbacteria bacterium]